MSTTEESEATTDVVDVAADLLPLELLQIAAIPDKAGYEVHIVDAMVHEDYLERLFELCDGALLFASSCILGFQVAHGARVAKSIRERFPSLEVGHVDGRAGL